MKLGVPVLLLALALSACGRQRVVTTPELPPLAPPSPPPRVVTPPEPEEPLSPAKPAEAPARKPQGTRTRAVDPPREAPKPEAVPPPVKAEVTPPVKDPKPPSTLQTLPPASEAETEKQVRQLLGQADYDLDHVDYKKLSTDAKGQYDQARRFITQAEQALAEKNLVLAQRLAEKAATIGGVLVGR